MDDPDFSRPSAAHGAARLPRDLNSTTLPSPPTSPWRNTASRVWSRRRAYPELGAALADLRETPFADRRARLERLLADAPEAVRITPSTNDPATAQRWFDVFEGAGLDGVIAKLDGCAQPAPDFAPEAQLAALPRR